jgi:hypothetical protein
VLQASSETFASFCPARVIVNYDGGNQAMQLGPKGRIHRSIMRAAFCSPTVDVVVSTRVNLETFWAYFSKHLHKLRGSVWECVFIEKCSFGGSKFNANVWFRISPMQKTCSPIVDKRMQKMLSGFSS